MRTLVERIIDSITIRKNEQFNPITRRELETVIQDIVEIEETSEFEETARVMMKHLGNYEKYHPHHTVIITNTSAELVEGIFAINKIMDYVKD